MRDRELVFVTGYFGARIPEEAQRIAACKGWPVLDLDKAIEERDGRSIARLCMMGGEHAYRNAEFEMVAELCGGASGEAEGKRGTSNDAATALCGSTGAEADGLVVACGDGVLYDEDTRGLILQNELVIAGEDQPLEELWENARNDEATYHAFMKFGTEEEKRAKFSEHHERQSALFKGIKEGIKEERK